MIAAVSGYGDTSHSAAQPLRLRFDLPVAIGQVSQVGFVGSSTEMSKKWR